MTDKELIERLRAGEGDAPLLINTAADRLEKMLTVVEAVQTYKIDFDSMSMEAEINSRTKVFEALATVQPERSPKFTESVNK